MSDSIGLDLTSNNDIIVVSGLPRSGTSLMMQMLQNGGVEVVTDQVRTADPDNPLGYLEYEAVKEIGKDASWLPQTRGKAFKMISLLIYHLPPTERYRILFMERDPEEVLRSQEAMLRRLKRSAAPHAEMLESYRIHLEHLDAWLKTRSDMTVLRVEYKNLVEQPGVQSKRISDFLGLSLDVDRMSSAVDPALYRNRNQSMT